MCFSATASFTASAVLSAAGIASIKKAPHKRDYFLAAIPLLFGIQQFFEGMIWVFPNSGLWIQFFVVGFLIFATIVWPFYVPIAVWSHERDKHRKNALRVLVVVGGIVSLYMFWLGLIQPVTLSFHEHSVRYSIENPITVWGILMYIMIVTSSFLLSTKTFLHWFGMAILFSAWLSWGIYEATFTSVWCFFAALISFSLYFYFHSKKK
jgi:hypothetical protein